MIVVGFATEDWHEVEIRRWAHDRGLDVTIERPPAGTPFPDKTFGRVLNRLGKGLADAVVVATVRTFAPDLVAHAWAVAVVARFKGRLHIADPDEDRIWSVPNDDDPDPERRHVRQVIARIGQLERARASSAGAAALSMPGRKRGLVPSNVPYGYRLDPADPMNLLRDDGVIALIAVGLTLRDEYRLPYVDIGEYWLQRGFRPRDTKTKVRLVWTPEQVRRILDRWRADELKPAPLDDTARLFLP